MTVVWRCHIPTRLQCKHGPCRTQQIENLESPIAASVAAWSHRKFQISDFQFSNLLLQDQRLLTDMLPI